METVDCVVIGAGPAGLAAGQALRGRGVDHLLLDRGQPGQTWRSQRWDSFRLNTPGWMSRMLGPAADDAYPVRSEVVRRLEALAAGGPLRPSVAVEGLEPDSDGFVLRTSAGPVRTRAVVAATGDQNVARTPALATAMPGGVTQVHAAGYRRPGALPAGAVLVVGSGQSGCQIAEDLLSAGRRVYVATSAVGRVPTPYRGRETLWWLVGDGFYDQRTQDVPDPAARLAPTPLLAPGGRPLGLPTLARAGAVLLGRPTAVVGDRILLDGSAEANVAAGEAFAARVRTMADELIRRDAVDAPAAEPDRDDEPVRLETVTELDLRAADVGSIVWCTGFGGDFSWLSDALRDATGQPVRDGAAGAVPGLWFVGLRWLTHRASSILYGFPRDAETVADQVVRHLGRRTPS